MPVIIRYRGLPYRLKANLEDLVPCFVDRMLIPAVRRTSDLAFLGLRRRQMGRLEALGSKLPIKKIEIETINRCNGECSFCPVNRHVESRPYALMTKELFDSIMRQLSEMSYRETLYFHSNNEPLLDSRIVELTARARAALPNAKLALWTNGALLDPARLDALGGVLNAIVVDNYNDQLTLNDSVKTIVEHCERNRYLQNIVEIRMRRTNELLTTRGGNAKNRTQMRPLLSPCIAPFEQLVIRPDGKISLCCNDALGENTMGDLTNDSITDVWNGELFRAMRSMLLHGRKHLIPCHGYDAFV